MIKINDYIKHKAFGIGKVLDISGDRAGMKATIIFTDSKGTIKKGGDNKYVRDITINKDFLSLLSDDELDKLHESPDYLMLENVQSNDESKLYRSIDEAIEGFKKDLNTENFDGAFYLSDERNYKVHFHQHALELFNENFFKKLLDSKDYEQLLKNFKMFFESRYKGHTQNLTHYLEPLKLREAIDTDEKAERFFTALFNVLYGNTEFEERFEDWIKALTEIDQAKWTMATIFLFVIHPEKYMYVKPETTKNALQVSGFFGEYSATPTYSYYQKVLDCSHYIFEKTKALGLNPKDMIDVQSFMWCIRPSYDNDGRAKS